MEWTVYFILLYSALFVFLFTPLRYVPSIQKEPILSFLKKKKNLVKKQGLNMFLVPIKLGLFKFSSYLILIGFLVSIKNLAT